MAQPFWWSLGIVAVLAALFFVLQARRLGRRKGRMRRAEDLARDVRPPDDTEPH